MLSLRTVRRLCAALDTVAVAAIAAGLSRPKSKSNFVSSNDNIIPQSTNPTDSIAPAPADPIPIPTSEFEQDGFVSEPALSKLKKERDPEKLFLIFQSNAQNRVIVENRFAFEDTVSRLAGASRHDLIEQLLEQQKALPQGRREGFLVRIIALYGKAGMQSHALRTFDEMPLYGCLRTIKSFNATLRVLCQSRRLDLVRSFFERAATQYEIQLDEISYNIYIKALCDDGRLELAYLILVEMERSNLEPDVVTYTTLMAAAYKSGQRVIGDGLWNLMLLRRCRPNVATFNVRIQHLINQNRAWKARKLMRKMIDSGIKPDALTFNLIIKGFFRVGQMEMAKAVFLAMAENGCDTSGKIYQTMVHYLCRAEDFELAYRLCRESMRRGWFPSVPSIQSLLQGLHCNSMNQRANEIMRLLRAKVPPLTAGELEVLSAAAFNTNGTRS